MNLRSLAASLLLLAASGFTPCVGQQPLFHVEELVHHPTQDGAVLALVPAQPLHLVVAWGSDERLGFQTPLIVAQPDRLLEIPLSTPNPGREIVYRVFVRASNGPRPLHRVPTLPPRGTPFSFGVAADTHAYAVWSKGVCGNSSPPLLQLKKTLQNIRNDDALRFLVLGTDIAMTKCGSCVACQVDGEAVSSKTISSFNDALLRWRRVLQTDLLGAVGADLPLLTVLGDHEAEQGWAPQDERVWSERARRLHVPLANETYSGGPAGRYYAVEAGDLLLVVLDVHRQTNVQPSTPDAWTLGRAQRAWLEQTLAGSSATFKLVTAEHLVGGLFDPSVAVQKGRGGITATDDGTPTGTFVGEQAELHELFVAHGVQVFLSYQDHVSAWGEKPGPDGQGDGVTYVMGGRASGVSPPAAGLAWYQEAMDYDGDGTPEFDTNVTGSRKVGYFRVTVEPDTRLLFEYVQTVTTLGGGANGTVLYSFAVDLDGHPSQVTP